ncbi:MAG: winged helix-turn-helix domain-containing protein [Myxococcales bacterium]|nr:winged helix-turn-helix domain-containing protein [Myxococcales bacterium]
MVREARTTDPRELSTAGLALLGRIAAVTHSKRFPEWVDEALHLVRVGAFADASELFVLERGAASLWLVGAEGSDADAFCSVERFDVGEGYPGVVAQSRHALSTRELRSDARYLRPEVLARGYHAYAAVPLLRGERLFGTLQVAWSAGSPDVARGQRFVEAVAPVLTAALLAARGDLESLPAPRGTRAVGEWLDDQAQRLQRFSHAEEVSVALLTPDSKGVADCGSSGATRVLCTRLSTAGPAGCPHADALAHGHVLEGPRSRWPAPCRCTLPAGYAQVMEVPLRDEGETLGYASLAWREPVERRPTRLLASLLFMGWSLPASLRPTFEARPVPAVFAPVTGRDTHHLGLQCFGPFTVYVDGRLVPRSAFRRAKALDILKTLILRQGRPISRDALVERLWPDADLEAGARSLHVAMHDLRRVVEPDRPGRRWDYVLSHGDMFFLDLGSNCSVDLLQWRELLAAARTANAKGAGDAEVIGLLERATALYRGDLFADDPDSAWCLAARATCRDQLLDALDRLARLYERVGEADRAVLTLRRAVQADPFRESAHQRLIEALERAHRVDEARDCFEVFLEVAWADGEAPLDAHMSTLGRRLGLPLGRRSAR